MKAVSSWSLHRTLGRYFGAAPAPAQRPSAADTATPRDGVPLLELPALLKEHGFDTVQLCHFHLPSRDRTYLDELRHALAESAIELDALLVDDGDLTHPDEGEAHRAWISGWVDDATTLGARRARVIAGRAAPSAEALRASAHGLAQLARDHDGISIVTENWLELTPGPREVLHILDATDGAVGLLIDTGNWSGPTKYDDLALIAARGETCHAKCHFGPEGADLDDYRRALETLRDNGYTGPLALVYDDEHVDEWTGLDIENRVVDAVFSGTR
ncbi:sugar phosphate isomerase/epimerase family protein [Leifsonia sp. NPDC058230]|uniref:sugar phosphate isomerase/epimerase family protein n=1 Tax=Leifsonia sp. NPDC058230 TaxID=3346391 RepID=UPI0036D7E357